MIIHSKLFRTGAADAVLADIVLHSTDAVNYRVDINTHDASHNYAVIFEAHILHAEEDHSLWSGMVVLG